MARHKKGPAQPGHWYRRPPFIAVALVLVMAGGFGIYRLDPLGASGPGPKPRAAASRPAAPATSPPGSPPVTQHPAHHPASKTLWQSGVSYPNAPDYAAAVNATQQFGSWRGHRVGVVVAWPTRVTWTDFIQVSSFYTTWARQPYTKAIGIPLFPDNAGETASGCIAGAYDGYWRTFAATMNSTGLAAEHTIIRLGWEMNQHANWGTPQQFAACFRRIVSTVRAIAPGLVWDWNVNRGPSADMPGSSILQAYPGNAYVDLIGVDSYDVWPPANTSGGWQQQLNGPYGLNFWLNFAKQHGKKLSVPEWGVSSGPLAPGHQGGDNPGYIKHMYSFFFANRNEIAFESYYNGQGTSIYNPVQNPQASAEYRSLWARL